MSKLIFPIIFSVLLFIGLSGTAGIKTVKSSQLTLIDRHMSIKNSNTPYSGRAIRKYDSGQLAEEAYYVNGNIEGLYRLWYKNGKLKMKIYFEEGIIQDKYQVWYNNGIKFIDFSYSQGKLDGPAYAWYDNGQLWFDCKFNGGNRSGLFAVWNKNGKLEFQVDVVDDAPLNGVYRSDTSGNIIIMPAFTYQYLVQNLMYKLSKMENKIIETK
ncbi:MAG: hypothetical protein GY756_11980 [bacterium]|nr:hypothetical protein [bacterium]